MRKLLIFILSLYSIGLITAQTVESPPGVVINHIPKSQEKYIGSPSICILPNGDYVASHDEFGPKSSEWRSAITNVFTSTDKGKTWKRISLIEGQFWSNLFYHKDALYIMGTNKHHGNFIIRKSVDGGKNWTNPYDNKNGLLLEGEYHTAPVPMLIHKGRIWRAVEYATAKSNRWGERYSAMVLSASINADLLDAKSWRKTNHLPFDASYLNGEFKAWLEGNVVQTKDDGIGNILRVHAPNLKDEYCAIVDISKSGKKAFFNSNNFFKMPGASKKFTIRWDEKTKKYWSLANHVPDTTISDIGNERLRNCVALISSTNLKEWKVERIILYHPDPKYHGFQYIDWQFEGDDIIFVSRTAYDDAEGGARGAHDANFLTFHRVKEFSKEKKSAIKQN